MNRPENYHTKQREAITAFFRASDGAHVTAAGIQAHFEGEGAPIGLSTIYRQLDRLVESGKARKFVTDSGIGNCYQYIDDRDDCHAHLHLKCEACGELLHLGEEELGDIRQHVYEKHGFEMSALRTVLYGKCGRCIIENNGTLPAEGGEV